jgi:hypothetical protein
MVMGTTVQVGLTMVSRNVKTGAIPVSITERKTCPDSCPFKKTVCYADNGPLAIHWNRISDGRAGTGWYEFLDKVKAMPRFQLWRHNQAGDLPGNGDTLDRIALAELVDANRGRRGFTYTHKPLKDSEDVEAVRNANRQGFTVNLSGNNLEHADELADKDCAPVVCVLPADVVGNVPVHTPKGRRVVVCPATYRDNTTCASCGLCARADRKVIVGFPVHGNGKHKYQG